MTTFIMDPFNILPFNSNFALVVTLCVVLFHTLIFLSLIILNIMFTLFTSICITETNFTIREN